MKHQQIYMWYYKEYGCWLKNEGDCGRAMNPGESFILCLGKDLSVPCRLGLAGQRLWYVEIGPNQVKLNRQLILDSENKRNYALVTLLAYGWVTDLGGS